MKLSVGIEFSYYENILFFEVYLRKLFKIIVINKKINPHIIDKEAKKVKHKILKLQNLIKLVMGNIKIIRLDLFSVLGTSDACYTAIIFGIMSSISKMIRIFLINQKIKSKQFDIKFIFNKEKK